MAREHFLVRLTAEAEKMLRRIGKKYGKKTYEVLRDRIFDLEIEPEQKGQALRGQLSGLYSMHYSRFRVIYRIDRGVAEVLVIGAGFHASGTRADIYRVIERMVDSGDLEIPDDDEDA